ncbi:MAG: tetratricopeptide repeat protein [Bacteroidota bacterium]
MKKTIILIAAIISISSCYSQTAHEYVLRGEAKYKLLDYRGAIADYDKAIEVEPKQYDTYISRGNAKYYLLDYRGAIADYDKAILLIPEKVSFLVVLTKRNAYINRAEVKYELQDYRGAIADYSKLIELGLDSLAYFDRGLAKSHLQDYRGAIVDYNKAIKFAPNHAPSYYKRGLAKSNLQDHRGAIADYNKAIEKMKWHGAFFEHRPDFSEDFIERKIVESADVISARGLAKSALQDYRGAIEDFNKAIELNPDDSKPYFSRGLAKLKIGQKDSGCLDFSKSGELGNETAYETIKKYCN